ncbi:MAG: hypothetical protein GWP19_05375 [Planctomycetia bacterium]|nr:hypothetical protein [Planctomycetia bacterium]
MNKYLIIFVLFISVLFGQSDDIPYDWSGQYGVITNNGRLMWNQDWRIGVLLIDGTFANYPTRFGPSYKNNFKFSNTGDFYEELHAFPDSSRIKSNIDYYRGDFSYDQLEINAEFAKKNCVIFLNGFKRTYKGPYGQYTDPQGGNNPLQQSYRLDYLSKDKDELLDISIGYFITDSRLNLQDLADFTHKEKIVSAGIGYSKDFNAWQYKIHGALFQQYYSMDFDSVRVYLNRFHLNQFISKKITNSALLKFGIEFDNQGLALVDSTKKDRFWSTIYAGWEKQSMGIKFGTTFANKELVPYFNIFACSEEGGIVKWQSNLIYEAVPKHMFLWKESDDNLFEQWLSTHTNAQINWKSIPLNISIDYSYNKNTDLVNKYYINDELINISDYLLSGSLSTQIPIFREWKINVQYRHIFEHNFYSDGIGDKVTIGIIASEKLFKKNLFAQIRLWGDAYLNHHQNLGYEGFHYGPYITDDTNLALPNYWVFNLELSAKISKMTIMWKVYNILQTAESITNRLFPNLNDDFLLITNSNNFPPMNRFIAFHIIWDFKN